MPTPTISDVLRARRLQSAHLSPTPLLSHPALDASVGAGVRVLVKHENLQPTGALKVRGGVTLLAAMDPAERARGVLSYSTGNHAQSLAYAAALFHVPCTIVMPQNPNPLKAAAVRRLGAELVEYGADFEEARRHAEQLAPRRGMRLVSAANEPDLIAGVATAYLEVFEQEPELDAIVVPVGGGSGAAAACLVAAAISPRCRVIAVQSRHSPAAHDSWRSGRCVERPNTTTAEGLATGSGFELTQRLIREHLADFRLVGDDDIRWAQWLLMRDARTVAEAAAAASLAGLLAARDGLAGQRVAIMCTGGNAGEAELRACLSAAPSGG
ncbi:serine/threonine dehydratase [Streptomyces nojiriensis]|uniref:Serine/threonine dehydratase n=1 Tax=Streptomyces nojiriensis TaxID=66374 RepID=A0ABQ3SIS0_9ACTN|nr:pyridoxal-phosphate dependent enzyme [Streptomyces nojiriensis]QTI49656.1 L-threo-3-hydroxyaspartate ammonia-lyase [Streptomyces nojiriensis]GGS23972.1 serine/threonine dehydratase [Streptomyces nojiriensis]GHI68043.1 serine/threonine dehydratase [Streptomyces nojiriensis]